MNIPQLDGGPLDIVKIAAAVYMVIDHGNEILFHAAYPICFMIGRGAFPLFCYALAMAIVKAGPDGARYAITRHCPRIFLAALISEPIYAPIMDSPPVNVLFTLALGAAFAGVSLKMNHWQFLLAGSLAVAANFFPSLSDFGFSGMAVPTLMIGVMQKRRGAWPLLIAVLCLVNQQTFFTGAVPIPEGAEGNILLVLTAIFTLTMPWLVLDKARDLKPGKRWLSKYALYIFYPGHLALFWFIHFGAEMTELGAWAEAWKQL
jgi:hypothetical protein